MKGFVEQRAVELGEYIIQSKATVRKTAKKFGISKSTVHKDVSERLKKVNPQLYREVKSVLEINKGMPSSAPISSDGTPSRQSH